MKIIELICILNGICLIGLIFIRTPLKMARIETNTNKSLDNTILLFTTIYAGLVLSLKCW
jgi:hypothetical protein